MAGGEGSRFWDYDGKRYLDFGSQSVSLNVGHQHPRLVAAIKEQAERLCTISPKFANDARSELARLLAEVTPGDLMRTFFTNGGAEANESAIKLARWYTGRQKIVARYRSYHGATAGAASLTGDSRRWPAEPGIPGVVRLLDPYEYRCPAGHPDPCPVCSGAPHLEEVLSHENPETVAAVVLETVTGANGVIVPPDGYLRSIREVCDRHGILLVLDEVMSGFGRTGRWFACEHWEVVPDILTLAKGINSGYVPLGAMVISEQLSDWIFDRPFQTGLTTSGHPLACASGVASIETLRDEGLVESGRKLSGRSWPRNSAGSQSVTTASATCAGLASCGASSSSRTARAASRWMQGPSPRKRSRAVFISSCAATSCLVAPPLVISREDLAEGLALLDEVLDRDYL